MTQNGYLMDRNKPFSTVIVGPTDQRHTGRVHNRKGFTLVELLMVMALVGIIATLSIPAYNNYVNSTKNRRAMSEIRTLGTELSAYALDKGTNPTSLADINRSGYLDPWKRPYVFTNIAGGGTPLEGPLEPLNKDYDLYSLGEDGLSAIADGDPTNADDIARFNDGSYVGMR